MSEPTPKKKVYIGPPAPEGSTCSHPGCGVTALYQCQGCMGCRCYAHWWKHSHTLSPLPAGWSGGPVPQHGGQSL